MAGHLVAGIGHHGFWGYSSSMDLLDAICNVNPSRSSVCSGPISILLVNPSDIRHIITTIARRRRHKLKFGLTAEDLPDIHFYLLESPMEVLARDLLLLEVLNDFEVPIRQRANIFLEIYGNCKVQERTARYIEQLGHGLRSLIANGSGKLEDLVDLSLLRYKDKDELEECFKSYKMSYPFDLDKYRDHRVRAYYGERYDSRVALADWDYHETIHSRASIIHIKQYKEWRASGIAFEFGDQNYAVPNKTLMSFTEGIIKDGKDKGLKKDVKGFWVDIIGSPYFAVGIDCETTSKKAESLFEIHNKGTGAEQHRHHAVEIAVFNLLSQLWEIETGAVYKMTKEHDVYSGLGKEGFPVSNQNDESESATAPIDEGGDLVQKKTDETVVPQKSVAKEVVEDENEVDELARAIKRAECIVETFKGVKIFPVKGSLAANFNKAGKYANYFDAIYVSTRSSQVIGEEYFGSLLKSGGLVAAETAKFIIPLPKLAQKAEFRSKLQAFASKQGFDTVPEPVPRRRRDEDDLESDVIFFRKP